jgi:hypothetical protein
MRATLVVVAIALVTHHATAFAPAHVRHRMSGRMASVARNEVRVAFDLDCIFYEDGPTCSGRFRCRPLPHGGRPSDCQGVRGSVSLDVTRSGPRDPYDPTWKGAGSVRFDDGSSCNFDGTVPFLFGVDVPGVFGRYRCTDAASVEIDSGSFGLRTLSVGAPFRRFD